jgi:glucose-1-phosphate thymidylyltransferase
MRIIILAAGYGTRLYPLTNTVAKPLVKINGVPMLNFLIDKINHLRNKVDIEEIRVIVNNKFYNSFLEWKKEYKIEATILNDGSNNPEDRLGAIGDISFGVGSHLADWLILGGDNLFEDSLASFIDFSLKKRPSPAIGIYDIKSKEEASRCGVIELDIDSRIVNFKEKPDNPFSTLVASCVYFFPKESLYLFEEFIRDHLNADACGKYIEWLSTNSKVFGYVLHGKWIDIGHIDSLRMAEKEFGSTVK